MEVSELDFHSVFGLLHAGSAPSLSSEDLASRISSCVQTVTNTDDTCLSLSLIESVISRLAAHSFTADAAVYYQDVIRRLFTERNLMAKLVSLLRCQDKLVSHLSAKCMSVYVIKELGIAGLSSCMWTDSCAAVLERSVSGCELDSCLWSVTAVIKGVLKADMGQNKREVLTRLLSALDSSITHLYRNLLPLSTKDPHSTDMKCVCKSMSEFIELLEALNAARLRHGLSSSAQRLSFTRCSSLLHVIRTDVEYVVKKRVLLLLKKSVLRRAGDDWALGDVQSASGEDLSLTEDLLSMADTVLQEVNAGWLKEVPVKAQASFFGGNCDVDGTMKKDDVILRADLRVRLKRSSI
nr:protein Lines homolog 1 isoform X3 [Danio rerio]|eukprot:XP_021333381.1 protein Lines homolog 1 isoform X3 [Danio rerio]